jgi:hypothetical protein
MIRSLFLSLVGGVVILAFAGCGGSDKDCPPGGIQSPTAEEASSAGGRLFSPVGLGLSEIPRSAAGQPGTGALERFLLTQDEMPIGYRSGPVWSVRRGAGEVSVATFSLDPELGTPDEPAPAAFALFVIGHYQDVTINDYFAELEASDLRTPQPLPAGVELRGVRPIDITLLASPSFGMRYVLDSTDALETEYCGDVPDEADWQRVITTRLRSFGEGSMIGWVMQFDSGEDRGLDYDLGVANRLRQKMRRESLVP